MSRDAAPSPSGGPALHAISLERIARGREARKRAPRSSHSTWTAPAGRVDPVAMIERANADRVPELVPIRHARLAESPFALFRGSADMMAADLASTPSSGLDVLACGDAHLSNFGIFATPERRLAFDLNDFDETAPGLFEWDLKRLAASFLLAARERGFGDAGGREAVLLMARSYRRQLAQLASMTTTDAWYQRIDVDQLMARLDEIGKERTRKGLLKLQNRTSIGAFPKLTEIVDGRVRIADQPPLITHPIDVDEQHAAVRAFLSAYQRTVQDHVRRVLDRYELVDVALKVVGVGSVGTRCLMALLMAGPDDPLFLQIKEAGPSVLAPYGPRQRSVHQGKRVVVGQRVLQAASDMFLGWATGAEGRHFYVRQLRDMKGSIEISRIRPQGFRVYAEACGEALANGHARGGDAAVLSGYLGQGDTMDRALADFARAYADQVESDWERVVAAVASGRLASEPA